MSRKLRRFLPSPAMLVALVALFSALGGSAYALVITGASIRNNSVTGKDIRKGSLKGHDLGRDAIGGRSIKESSLGPVPVAGVATGLTRFAVVDNLGQLRRGRGVSSAVREAAGRYQVIFDGDVRNCAYFATIGDAGATAAGSGSQITTAALASNVNGVAIRTWGPGGQELGNRSFHLIVTC